MEPEIVERRRISGKGILIVPEDKRDFRRYTLTSSLLRTPINQFTDRDWNPQRSFFGNMVFFRDGTVIRDEPIIWEQQAWDFYPPYDGQTQLALNCAYQGILASFVNLGTALGLTVVSVQNEINAFTQLVDMWDTVQVKCFSSSAVELILFAEDFHLCADQPKNPSPPPKREPDDPPPPPEPPFEPPDPENPENPRVPPPITDISPPYEGEDDGGNTVPFQGDENEPPGPPTEGLPCGRYEVTMKYTLTQAPFPGDVQTVKVRAFGVIGQFTFSLPSSPARANLFLECQGVFDRLATPAQETTTCLEFGQFLLGNSGITIGAGVEISDLFIESIESV